MFYEVTVKETALLFEFQFISIPLIQNKRLSRETKQTEYKSVWK